MAFKLIPQCSAQEDLEGGTSRPRTEANVERRHARASGQLHRGVDAAAVY